MAKKKETFSFIEQPQLLEGAIDNAFIPGTKTDYLVQLVPVDALPEAQDYFRKHSTADTVAVVHMPTGVMGAAPFRAIEHPHIDRTPNPITGAELWTTDVGPRGPAGHFAVTADGYRFSRIKRRRSKPLRVKFQKSFAAEAFELAAGRLQSHEAGDLDLRPEPVEVLTRKGRVWLWSSRWRELHAEPELKERPLSLSNDGLVHYLGSRGSTNISFQGVVSK
jgi:hypothetical protein